MLKWELKLTSETVRLMRRIADAEIDSQPEGEGDGGDGYVGTSQYHTVANSLVRQGMVTAKPAVEMLKARRSRSGSAGTPSKYRLTDLGVAILAALDAELDDLRGVRS